MFKCSDTSRFWGREVSLKYHKSIIFYRICELFLENFACFLEILARFLKICATF